MNTLCAKCGLLNGSAGLGDPCEACGAVLTDSTDKEARKPVAADLNKTPIGAILLYKLHGLGAAKRLMKTPGLLASSLPRRFRRSPWIMPVREGSPPRYRKVDLDAGKDIPRARLKSATAALERRGFKPFIDRRDDGSEPPSGERLFINAEKKLYAMALLDGYSGEFSTGVAACPPGKGLILATTASPPLLADPQSEIISIPGADVGELMAAVERAAPAKIRKDHEPSPGVFLTALFESRIRTIDHAVKSGRGVPAEKGRRAGVIEAGAAPVCAYHPGAAAVRRCGLCGKPVCRVCHVYYDGHDYCKECLSPEAEDAAATPLDFTGELRPAGFAARGAIRLAEVAGLLLAIVYFFPESGSPGSMIAYQAMAMAGFIVYFQATVKRWGGTPLQRAFGLSVIDFHGEPLSPSAVCVRTGYILMTVIAVIPALGYLTALWDPHRRGWHDRMAGTVVVTSGGRAKEMAGAAALIAMIAFAAYQLPRAGDVFIRAGDTAFGPARGATLLDPVWEREIMGRAALFDGAAAAVTKDGLVAFGLPDGAVVWKPSIDGVKGLWPDPYSGIILALADEGGKPVAAALSKQDGAELWRSPLSSRPAADPVFHSGGFYLIADGEVASFNRSGEAVWKHRPKEGRPRRVTAFHGSALVDLDTGRGRATLILSDRDGANKAFLEGVTPAAQGSQTAYLLTGAGGTVLYDVRKGVPVWSAPRGRRFLESKPSPGDFYYTASAAIWKTSGGQAFGYPEGCAGAGVFRNAVVVSCAGEGAVRLLDRRSGATLAVMDWRAFYKIEMIGETESGYILSAFRKTGSGKSEAWLLSIDRSFKKAKSAPLGVFNAEPGIDYRAGDGRIVMSGEGFAGLYEPPL